MALSHSSDCSVALVSVGAAWAAHGLLVVKVIPVSSELT